MMNSRSYSALGAERELVCNTPRLGTFNRLVVVLKVEAEIIDLKSSTPNLDRLKNVFRADRLEMIIFMFW